MKDSEIKEIKKGRENLKHPNSISVGVTWINGLAVFNEGTVWANVYFGVCHFSQKVFAVTPIDWMKPVHSIKEFFVDPLDQFCERAFTCLNFNCILNRFSKDMFLHEFKDVGYFTAGLPNDVGSKALWFNDKEYKTFWSKLLMKHGTMPEGGIIDVNPNKEEGNLIIKGA